MRVFSVKLLMAAVVVLGAWTAYGEASYKLGCVKVYQEKKVTVKVPAYYSPEFAGEGDGNFTLNIAGQLSVTGKEECVNSLPPFQTYEAMISYVRENYCSSSHRPVGTIFFSSTAYPDLVRQVPAGYGSIDPSSFNIKFGYGETLPTPRYGDWGAIMIYKHITCQL